MAQKDIKTRGPATGYYEGNGRKIAILFDEATFIQIAAVAKQRGISFAGVVRSLCVTGIKAEKP